MELTLNIADAIAPAARLPLSFLTLPLLGVCLALSGAGGSFFVRVWFFCFGIETEKAADADSLKFCEREQVDVFECQLLGSIGVLRAAE